MKTDYEKMREDLMRLTVKELKALAKSEGICLGYDGSRKDTTVAAIVSHRRHIEKERGDYCGEFAWKHDVSMIKEGA